MIDLLPIYKRADGSFVLGEKGNQYGVAFKDEYCRYPWSEVEAYLLDHPEALIPEPVPPPPTESELAAREVAEAHAYLASTDWIVAKIGEVQMQGKSITTLLTKYKAELGKRAAARVTINGA